MKIGQSCRSKFKYRRTNKNNWLLMCTMRKEEKIEKFSYLVGDHATICTTEGEILEGIETTKEKKWSS